MIVCLIEFGTVPGKEDRRRELVTQLLVEAATIDGFISKETFRSMDSDRVVTLSYWTDDASLRAWMRNAQHRLAIPEGQKEVFTYYNIQLAEVTSDKKWVKKTPPTSPASSTPDPSP